MLNINVGGQCYQWFFLTPHCPQLFSKTMIFPVICDLPDNVFKGTGNFFFFIQNFYQKIFQKLTTTKMYIYNNNCNGAI